MKQTTISRRTLLTSLAHLLIAGFAFITTATAYSDDDPVVGTWKWSDGSIVKIHNDGTAVVTDGRRPHATWNCFDPTPPRKYRIRWGNKWADTIRLLKHHDELTGINPAKY